MNGVDRHGQGRNLEQLASSLQRLLPNLLATTQNVQDDPIIKIASSKDVSWLQGFATPGDAHELDQVVEEAFAIFDERLRVNHPRFMGLIPSPTSPIAWVADTIANAFNALGASKLQASGPVAVEKKLIDWLGDQVDLPETRGGLFVSGGSMANLMAMVMARDRHLPSDKHDRAAAYLSSETHFSVAKALRVLGFGQEHIRSVPVNDEFQMDAKALDEMLARDREAGLVPFVVVATCGTTNTGAVDPLKDISRVCKEHELWMHVDGAYGASVALSASKRHLVADLSYADSVSWDAHKWLFQTYSCGILLVRDRLRLVHSFMNSGDYLRDGVAHEDPDIPNFWDYSMELTRPAHRAMKLWFTLRVLGTQRIGEMIDHGFELARTVEEQLQSLQDWKITSSSSDSLAILTFRFAPQGLREDKLDEINAAISTQLISSNTAGILTTKVCGRVVLRVCALHPDLSLADMSTIIEEANRIARQLAATESDGNRSQPNQIA